MRSILPTAPFDLVDLLFDFKGFEVVKFGLMGLKLRMELVLAGFFLLYISSSSTQKCLPLHILLKL